MLVIFMGALGGMLSMGIVGLFLGSVVLALGFELFMAWLTDAGMSAAPGPGESSDEVRSVAEGPERSGASAPVA
jgi:predicted PurR-regulated permease PerM